MKLNEKPGLFVVANSAKCTGCKACEMACFAVHNKKRNNVGKTVGTVTVPVVPKLYLTKTDDACMPIQCKHCEDAPCLAMCKKHAISRIDGKVVVDEEKCIGCKDCLMACPFGAVALLPYSKNGKPVMQADTDDVKIIASKCDLCNGIEGGPACVAVCPNDALRLVDVEAERIEKNIKAAEGLSLLASMN